MGVMGKLEIEVDIKHSGDVFHELFAINPQQVSTILPHMLHSCEVHEGEFGKPGSIIQWEYPHNGKKCVIREIIEAVDEEKKMFRYRVIEGSDLLNDYKSMTISLHVITKDTFDAIKWEIEFERFDDYGPYPIDLMDLIIQATRDVEAHHVNA